MMTAAFTCIAAETMPSDTLDIAVVTAERGLNISHKDTVTISGGMGMTDVLLNFPGLQISDMGGHAGLKTISMRGLGSAHTAIYIDGVRVGNMQSGQTDLGMIDMQNCTAAVMDYAQNSINFITAKPVFFPSGDGNGTRRFSGKASVSGGSFGTWSPALKFGWKASERLTLSANASVLSSKGDFPYHATDENGAGYSSRRSGNDIMQVRAGADIYGMTGNGQWTAKAYFNSSDRGTPGPLSYPSEDRQKDMNIFVQGTLHQRFSRLYTLDLSAKAAYDDLNYISSWGDSRYVQHEAQLHSSHIFSISKNWKASLAAGAQWDGLGSESYGTVSENGKSGLISRFGAICAMAASFRTRILTAEAALEYSGTFDMNVPGVPRANTRHSLSPSADLRIYAAKGLEITAFARRAYRVPTFNELYYSGYGNPHLKPEDAWLADIGIRWNRSYDKWKTAAQADGFFNHLTDKIASAPSPDNQSIWLPYNIGKVLSAGLDANARADWKSEAWETGMSLRYSFQDARDRTSGSASYGSQVPYIARHSITASAHAGYMGWNLGIQWNLRAGRCDTAGDLDDWNTLDASLSKTFRLCRKEKRQQGHGTALSASLTARNLTGTAYELSRGYPMPGTSVLGSLSFMF